MGFFGKKRQPTSLEKRWAREEEGKWQPVSEPFSKKGQRLTVYKSPDDETLVQVTDEEGNTRPFDSCDDALDFMEGQAGSSKERK